MDNTSKKRTFDIFFKKIGVDNAYNILSSHFTDDEIRDILNDNMAQIFDITWQLQHGNGQI